MTSNDYLAYSATTVFANKDVAVPKPYLHPIACSAQVPSSCCARTVVLHHTWAHPSADHTYHTAVAVAAASPCFPASILYSLYWRFLLSKCPAHTPPPACTPNYPLPTKLIHTRQLTHLTLSAPKPGTCIPSHTQPPPPERAPLAVPHVALLVHGSPLEVPRFVLLVT